MDKCACKKGEKCNFEYELCKVFKSEQMYPQTIARNGPRGILHYVSKSQKYGDRNTICVFCETIRNMFEVFALMYTAI